MEKTVEKEKTRIVIETVVIGVEERFKRVYVSGFGDNAIFHNKSLGWFVHLDGSFEALHVGFDKPEWGVGDRVRIVLESL